MPFQPIGADPVTGALPGVVENRLNTLINAIISAAPTVIAAATQAVTTALSQAGTFTGLKQTGALDDYGVVFQDANGNVSVWNSTTADGGPLPEAIAIINQIVAAANSGAVLTNVGSLGYAYVIVDSNGYMGFAITDDGKMEGTLSQNIIDTIVATVVPQVPTTAEFFKPKATDPVIRITSGPDINIYSDSLLASGQAAAGITEATGKTVRTSGVGGENAFGIAARANAIPFIMTPVDAGGNALPEFPATGSVDVKFRTALPGANGGVGGWPLLQGSGGGNRGTIDGVQWDFSIRSKGPTAYPSHDAADIYQLTRVTAGSVIPAPRGRVFLYEWAESRKNDIAIINIGQNGSGADLTVFDSEIDGILTAARAIATSLKSADRKFLFMTQTAVDNTGWTSYEKAFAKEFGRRFCNVRRFFIDDAFAIIGMTPDSDNQADIALGRVPRYFRRVNGGVLDGVHYNADGEKLLGTNLFTPRMKELGYI